APVSGQLIWELSVDEPSMPKPIGTRIEEGDIVCFISAYYGQEEVKSLFSGKLCAVAAEQGATVRKGDVIALIE
ncbi:MAG: oxaloacetate decarboxylase, partial [Bacteroidales bacterium]|nr:oxaloacetate decarboxylase [Bacteroidales bacterium]